MRSEFDSSTAYCTYAHQFGGNENILVSNDIRQTTNDKRHSSRYHNKRTVDRTPYRVKFHVVVDRQIYVILYQNTQLSARQVKMEKFIAEISEEFPCRKKLLTELYQFFGYPDHAIPSSMYLYGAAGVGKTSILLKTLNYLQITHAMIDCIEQYAPKMFYECIVNVFRGHDLTQNNNFENFAPCDSTESFLDEMNALDTSKTYVLVLKNYQRLHDMDANILPVLMRFNTLLPGLNIACILIGSKSTTQHNSEMGLVPCHNIHCDHYSKSDLLKILLLQMNHLKQTMQKLVHEDRVNRVKRDERMAILDDLHMDFYSDYFSIFLDTFFSICRNVKELLYLSNANFPIYCKPVIDGLIKKNDIRKLWKNMELPFKTAMGTIYCRVDQKNANVRIVCDVSISFLPLTNENYFFYFIQNKMADDEGPSTEITISSSTKRTLQQLELPFYTKYLLIAAYLASHNDAKIDKRLFMKNHGKQRKRMQSVRANAVVYFPYLIFNVIFFFIGKSENSSQ